MTEFLRANFVRPATSGKRMQFVDLAKGICILFVVMLHCGYSMPVVNQLRMPLYFFLSGLFFKDYGSVGGSIMVKLHKLIVPFFFFFTLAALFYGTLRYNYGGEHRFVVWYDFNDYFDNCTLWFLLALFYDYLIVLMVCRISPRLDDRLLMIGVLTCFGFYLTDFHNFMYRLVSALMSLPFYFMGYMFKSTSLLSAPCTRARNSLWALLGVALLFASWLVLTEYQYVFIHYNDVSVIGNKLLAHLVSAACVVGALLVCRFVVWLPFISYLGRYSIVVLGLHTMYATVGEMLVSKFGITEDLKHIVMLICAVVLSWISIPICVKGLPWLCAQIETSAILQRYEAVKRWFTVGLLKLD